MAKLAVEIMPSDILQGIPDDPMKCPVARAIRRALGPNVADRVYMTPIGGVRLFRNGMYARLSYLTPEDFSKFIIDYDNKRPVKAMSGEFEIVDRLVWEDPYAYFSH